MCFAASKHTVLSYILSLWYSHIRPAAATAPMLICENHPNTCGAMCQKIVDAEVSLRRSDLGFPVSWTVFCISIKLMCVSPHWHCQFMANSLSILIRYTNNKFVSVCSFYANSKPSGWLPLINCLHFTLPVVNERHAFRCKNVPVSEIVYVRN